MRKVIEINGKKVIPTELTFNSICRLEDMGVEMATVETHMMSFVRGYVALCLNCSVEQAGKEIENHCIAGGNLESIYDCLSEAMEESGFFQALNKEEKKETPTTQE